MATLSERMLGDLVRQTSVAKRLYVFRRDPLALIAVAIILVAGLGAAFAPILAPYPEQGRGTPAISSKFIAPGPDHLLGTDDVGRDILSRVLFGGRISLSMGVLVVVLGVLIGIPSLTACDCGLSVSWSQLSEQSHCYNGHVVAVVHAHGSPLGVERAGATVHCCRSLYGHQSLADHYPACYPQHRWPGFGAGYNGYRSGHPDRVRIELYRVGCSSTHSRLGRDGQRRSSLHLWAVVVCGLSGSGNTPGRACFQFAGG